MKISNRSVNIIIISIYIITLLCGVGTIVSNEAIDIIRKVLILVLPFLINVSIVIDNKGCIDFNKYRPYIIFIILNISWYILSILFGINKGIYNLVGLYNFTNILVLLFLITKIEIDNKTKKKIINAFIYSALVSCVYGIIEYVFKIDLNTFANSKYPGIFGRVSSTFFLPTLFDKYAVLLFSFISYISFKNDKLLYKIVMLLLGINVTLTFSRGGFIALVFVFIVYSIYSIINKKYINIIIPVLTFVISFLIPGYIYFFQANLNYGYNKLHIPENLRIAFVDEIEETDKIYDSADDSSLEYRKYYNSVGLEIIKEKPIIGIGLNNYSYIYNNQNISNYLKDSSVLIEGLPYMYPHNGYIQMASEIGVTGLLLFISYVVYIMYDSIKNKKSFKYYGILILVVFLLGNLTESLIYNKQYMYIFVILYGILNNTEVLKKKKK